MTNWNNWKITDEQAEQIRNGNQIARDKFYFDNLDRIRAMAYNYSQRNPRCKGLVDDMLQSVYLDLTLFADEASRPVKNGVALSTFIYTSFRYTPWGGLVLCLENNPKKVSNLSIYECNDVWELDRLYNQRDDEKQTFADFVPAPDMIDRTDYTESIKKVCADYLSPRVKEYFDYFIELYAPSVIGQKMGISESHYGALGCRMKAALIKHYAEILPRLEDLGIDVDYWKDKEPYDPKATERKYKLTPQQRERARESMRRQRAKNKQQTTQTFPSVA